MINKKKGNLLEQHAEKIVLGVVGIISVVLLWVFVLSSPNAEKIDGKKLGPGEIDRYLGTQALLLDEALKKDPVERPPTSTNEMMTIFARKMGNTIEEVPDFRIPGVAPNPGAVEEKRLYAMPDVGGVDEVVVEAIRGAAHVPLDEIGPDNPYDKAMTKVDDIDLVTVQVSFDVAALHRNFIQSFVMGRNVKNEWKDEDLAAPVFASAQLQRRRSLEGGRWSEWEVVPRPSIDQYRAKLNVPEKVADLAYDINVQKTQFKALEFQQNLLQPRPYNFASSNAVWLTPSFHKEYVEIEEKDKQEARREEREKVRDEKARDRGGSSQGGYDGTRSRSRTPTRTTTRTTQSDRSADYGQGGYDGSTRGREPAGRRRTNDPRRSSRDTMGAGGIYEEGGEFGYGPDFQRRGKQERTVDDVIADNVKIIIHQGTRLDEMREPLVLWAHDDTVEPGNTYQYKIRLGVFNPIAGKNWFYPQEQQYKDQVILWSAFSEVTDEIAIDPKVYFFPTDVARAGAGTVKMDVFKYHFGNWRNEAFDVHPGEMIGKTVVFKAQRPGGREDSGEYGYGGDMTANAMPEEIDFGTGAMLVDIVKADAWMGLGSLVRTKITDVLYTLDGVTMMRLPVKRNNWSPAMKVRYASIEDAAKGARDDARLFQRQGQNKVDLFKQQGNRFSPRGPGGMRDGRGGDYMMGPEGYNMDPRRGDYR